MQKTSHRLYKSLPILSHAFKDHKVKNMLEAILVATTLAPVNTSLMSNCVATSVPNPVFPVVVSPYHYPPSCTGPVTILQCGIAIIPHNGLAYPHLLILASTLKPLTTATSLSQLKGSVKPLTISVQCVGWMIVLGTL